MLMFSSGIEYNEILRQFYAVQLKLWYLNTWTAKIRLCFKHAAAKQANRDRTYLGAKELHTQTLPLNIQLRSSIFVYYVSHLNSMLSVSDFVSISTSFRAGQNKMHCAKVIQLYKNNCTRVLQLH